MQIRFVHGDDPLVSFWEGSEGRCGAVASHALLDAQSVSGIAQAGAKVVLALGRVTTAALGNAEVDIVRLGSNVQDAASTFVRSLFSDEASASKAEETTAQS